MNTGHDLVLQLSDSQGNLSAGVFVVLDVVQPDTRREGALRTSVDLTVPVTDANGELPARLIVGHTSGPFELAVITGDKRTVCHLTVSPDREQVVLVEVSGNNQVAEPGEELELPLVSRLEDQFGNPLPDEEVMAEVVQGEGALQPVDTPLTLGIGTTSQVSGLTNGQGEVSFFLRVAAEDVVTRVSAFGQERLFQTTVGFANLSDIAVDQNGTLVVVDAGLDAVIRVDPAKGHRTLVSGRLRGRGRPFTTPRGIAVEADGALVVVGGVKTVTGTSTQAVTRVDPADGQRTVISATVNPNDLSGSPIGTGPGLQRPQDIAVGRDGTLWVVDGSDGFGRQAVIKLERDPMDPNIWHRTLFSGLDRETGEPIGRGPGFFFFPREIAYVAGNTLLVSGRLSESPGTDCFSATQQGDCFEGIVRIDETGDRTVVARGRPTQDPIVNCPDLGPLGSLSKVDGFVIESSGTLAILNNRSGFGIASVRRVLLGAVLPNNSCVVSEAASAERSAGVGQGQGLIRPTSVAIEADGSLVVVDALLNAVIRIAPDSGDRTIVSRGTTFGQGRSFLSPSGIATEADGEVIAVDNHDATVVRIDPETGDRTVVAGCREIGCSRTDRVGDNRFPFTILFTNVVAANSALFGVGNMMPIDTFNPTFPAVSRVDLQNGTRRIISGCPVANDVCIDPIFGKGPPFIGRLAAVAATEAHLVAILRGNAEAAVVRVALTTGDRTVVSGCLEPNCTSEQVIGNGPSLVNPNSISVLGAHYFVVDGTRAALIRVDSVTGQRTIVSGLEPDTRERVGQGPLFVFPFAIAVEDEQTVIVISTVADFTAVVRVDVASGNRTIVSSSPPERNLPGKRIDALTYWGSEDVFMLADRAPKLFRLTTEGVATLVGYTDHRPNGLAFSTHAMSLLYSVSQDDNQLRVVETLQGATQSAVTITLDGETVSGGHGLATHPTTGELWALLDLKGIAALTLARIDPSTGVAQRVGETRVSFTGLAFDATGTLYGVSEGSRDMPDKRLFILSTTDATSTCVLALDRGGRGEVIAFNSMNESLYHASGELDSIFESVDLAQPSTCDTPAVTFDIPLSFLGRGAGPSLTLPRRIAVEANGNLVMTDKGLQAVLRIDPVTGNRTILAR